MGDSGNRGSNMGVGNMTSHSGIYHNGIEQVDFHNYGEIYLDAQADTVCTLADTYYPMAGTFSGGPTNGFSSAADGTLTYNGGRKLFQFIGSSDMGVDKACETTYGLHINGVLAPGAETPHDFTAAAKTEGIGIVAFVWFDPGDAITVKIKSDVAATTVTVKTLRMGFVELI
jgi:hypothetical protein